MSAIAEVWRHSELSMAAYGSLALGPIAPVRLTVNQVGMSPSQAARFANDAQVVDSFTDASGVSATLFRQGSQLCVAIRGFEPQAGDILASGLLALGVSAQLNPQFDVLKTKMDQWLAEGGPLHDQVFTMAGHSLGGYLAAALKQRYSTQISAAYLFNAPGSGGLIGNIADLVSGVFGESSPGVNGVWNIKASEGLSFITGLGAQPSAGIAVQIEADPGLGFRNHDIYRLVDALAIQSLYLAIVPSLTAAQSNALIDASGNPMNQTLEAALDALRLLLGSGTNATPTENRDALYKNLYGLISSDRYQALVETGDAQLTVLAGSEAATVAGWAANADARGLAVRYALKALNPFALIGADYSVFDMDGALELYDVATQKDGITARYLSDRAAFVERKLWFSSEDLNPVNPGNTTYNPEQPISFINELTSSFFLDVASGYQIRQGPYFPSTHVYAFGGDTADVLVGRGVDDQLYGGAGSDILTGGQGDGDYLEGGAGADVYQFKSGDGVDTVLDADGKGLLVRDGKPVGVGVKHSDGVWIFGDTTYTKVDSDLEVSFSATDKLTLKDFDFAAAQEASYDGIRLVDAPNTPQSPQRIFVGDKEDWDSNPAEDGVQTQTEFDNVVRADGKDGRPDIAQADRADTFYGRTGEDGEEFETAGGDDVVYGDGPSSATSSSGGSDLIETGAGRDFAYAGAGDDWVEGGEGGDVLSGGFGDDVLLGGQSLDQELDLAQAIAIGEFDDEAPGPADLISGDAGDDVILAESTADFIAGGEGADIVVAGAGDDTIYGDGTVASASLGWIATRVANVTGGLKEYRVDTINLEFSNPAGLGSADVIYGGAGKDWIFGGAGDDYIEGGNSAGDANVEDDVLLGEAGSDILIGGSGNDVLAGDAEAVDVAGLPGDDYLDGGAGDDELFGGKGDDILFGGSGDDTLIGNDGDDMLVGGPGLDILVGGAGKDTYVFNRGDGVEVIQDTPAGAGDPEASILVLGEGISRSDVKFRLGSLMIDLGGGDAVHINGAGGFDPQDPLRTPAIDFIQFADGSSMSYQDVLDQGFDLEGTDEGDVVFGTAVTDRIVLLGGDDFGSGEAGDDLLDGGAGDDVLDGGEGDDVLIGGEGADVMRGGTGNDLFRAGEGDVVIDSGDANALDLSAWAALDATNLEITQYEADGGDLYLSLHQRDAGHPGETPENGGVSAQGLELGAFAVVELNDGAGGTVTLSGADLLAQYAAVGLAYRGGERAELLSGTAHGDFLFGGGGADTLRGDGGDDVFDGGAGDDVLEGGAGDDTYTLGFNGGRDLIIEDASEAESANTVQLGSLVTPAMVRAARSADDLRLSLGSSGDALQVKDFYLQPQAWQERWSVRDEAGNSLALAELFASPATQPEGWLEQQKAAYQSRREQLFGAGRLAEGFVALGDGTYKRVDQDFLYDLGRSTTTTILNRLSTATTFQSNAGPAEGVFFEEALYTAPESEAEATRVVARPLVDSDGAGRSAVSPGNSTGSLPNGTFIPIGSPFPGFSGGGFKVEPGDVLVPVYGPRIGLRPGAGGNTEVDPSSLDPRFFVLAGYRVFHSVQGSLSERAVRDTIETANTVVTIDGEVAAPRMLGGNAANAILAASALLVEARGGDDTITLTLNAGGIDRSNFFSAPDWRANVDLASQVDPFSRSLAQQRYQVAHQTATSRSAEENALAPREHVLGGFADGGIGDDTISGSEGQDSIFGGDGADAIDGGLGSDTYLYSADESGIDSLADSGSNELAYLDWYYWSQGVLNWDERQAFGGTYRTESGENFVQYFDTLEQAQAEMRQHFQLSPIRYIEPLTVAAPTLTRGDTATLEQLMGLGVMAHDVVRFGTGLALADLDLSVTGNTLSVRWGNAGFDLAIPGAEGYRLGEGIEVFEFADGSSYSLEQVLQLSRVVLPGDILGTEDFDNLEGTDAADRLFGFGSGDNLFGYGGNDVLIGGAGEFDYLEGGEGDDTYRYDPGDGVDGIFDAGGMDTVRFGAGVAPDDLLVASDPYGTLYLEMPGTGTRIEIYSGLAEETKIERVIFDDGTVWGDIESRIAISTATAANDIINLSGADDVVDALAGDDWVFGNGGDDILSGGQGSDSLEGWAGHNLLLGGAGDDFLHPGWDVQVEDEIDAANFFIGGGGADNVQAGPGANLIAFNLGDGEDWVAAGPGDSLVLSLGGASAADIAISQADGAMRIEIGASDSISSWSYGATMEEWPHATLQIIGPDIRTYDLNAVIAIYLDARAQDGSLVHWSAEAALEGNLLSISTTHAYGGAIAYQYATAGSVADLSTTQIQSVLAAGDFAAAPQPIAPGASNHVPAPDQPIPAQFVEAGSPLAFSVPATAFSDADGDPLIFSAALFGGAALPAWLSLDGSTGSFAGSPQATAIGVYHLALTATDPSGETAVGDFALTVQAAAGSSVTGRAGSDVIVGAGGDETLVGRGGSDYLSGQAGDDTLRGGAGQDVLQGGEGADVLRGGAGQNLLDGGAGADTLYGGGATTVLAGGGGNDVIRAGTGTDIVLFNRGDGADVVHADAAGDNTLSLGGGILYSDLSLRKSGKDLILDVGAGDSLTFKGWYNGKTSVLNLQLIADAMSDFDASSSDPLHSRRINAFDFAGLVDAFDAARVASPGLSSWALTNALLEFHLSASDDAALGGDLAYYYGKQRSFQGMSLTAAQEVLGSADLGVQAQALRPLSGLQEGFLKLG